MRRTFIAVVLVALGASAARAQEISLAPMDLLAYYELGEHTRVARLLTAANTGDFADLIAAIKHDGPAWIDADGPKWADRRRRVLATFALEVAQAGLETQWANSKDLLEWTCALLRKERAVSPFERTWHLAALAIVEGSRELEALKIHIAHMEKRVPGEPRLLLAHAFIVETYYWDDVMGGTHDQQLDTRDPIEGLTLLLKHDATRNEAAMRLGYFSWRRGQPEQALAYLAQVKQPDDPGQAHLVQLFSTWVYDALKQPDRAIESLRAALDAVPGAQAATLYLAVRLHAAGRGQEAKGLMDAMLATDPPVFDPWRNFGYGDLRRWPVLVAELRSTLR